MTKNKSGLTDEENNHSDWIELRNVSAASVNLEGWFLANSTNKANWWRFPATNIAPQSYLIVFASGKNRVVSGLPLHTSFQLSSLGEYLALIEPDETTITSEFAPYPEQFEDISYGMGISATTNEWIASGATARYLVPTNGTLGSLWTALEFDDSSWKSGTTGIGFDAHATNSTSGLYSYWPIEEGTGSIASNWVAGGANGILQGAVWVNDPTRGTVLSFNGLDSYVSAGTIPRMGQSTSNFTWSFWLQLRSVANGNSVILGNRSGGAFGLTQFIKFTPSNFEYYREGNIGFIPQSIPTGDWLHLAVVKQGMDLKYYENGVLVGSSIAQDDIDENPFYWGGDPGAAEEFSDGLLDDISLWTVALSETQIQQLYQGISPATLNDLGGNATPDFQSAMWGVNASAYLRIPFEATSNSTIAQIQLKMRYNDGFVAYLNGMEVARRNAPAELVWNSEATAEHSLSAAMTWETFDLSGHLDALRAGTNVLAIQGLNLNATNADFLILPELMATTETELGWQYFKAPTPGAVNGTGVLGYVAGVEFDHERGFYDTPFTVSLTCATAGADIRYTTNGTEPSISNGLAYTGPIPINGNTCLRAGAYITGRESKNPGAQTYLFLDQVLTQTGAGYPNAWGNDWQMDPRVVNSAEYSGRIRNDLKSLPVVSIALDSEAFWGNNGIYTHAAVGGDAYERPCSAEMFFPDGSQAGFQIDCGIHIVGAASRVMSPKHGVGLFFRNKYGAGKLKYKFFDNSSLKEFDSLAFRPNFNMSWVRTDDSGPLNNQNADGAERTHAIYVRDQFTKESQLAQGDASAHERFVHLYINGLYWGLYNPSERTDASFAAAYYGGAKEDYDAIFSDSSTVPVATDGDKTAWNTMLQIAQGGLSTPAAYGQIQQYLDVTNLADYMMLNFYCSTVDWPWQNWNAARKRETNAQFHFFVWDAEYALETEPWVPDDRTGVGTDSGEANSPAYFYYQLRQNPEWRLLFADRAHLHFFNNGALTTNQTIPRFVKLCDTIDSAIVGESARWGDVVRTSKPYTRNVEWLTEKKRLLTEFFPKRSSHMIQLFTNAHLYPTLPAPEFTSYVGDLTQQVQCDNSSTTGTIYYTTNGADPRLAGGAISPDALVYHGPFTIATNQTFLARALQGDTWSALTTRASIMTNAPALPPTLTVQITGSDAVISWPATTTDFVLESTENLLSPRWQAVPEVTGNRITVSARAGTRYYRLRK